MARIALLDLNAGLPNRGVTALLRAVEETGHTAEVVDVRRGDPLPSNPDAVLTSGGPGSPLEPGDWQEPLQEWIREIVDKDIPFLAICYGFQVACRALGAELKVLTQPRFGLHPVLPTADGESDKWLSRALPSWCFEQRRFGVWGLDDRVLAQGDEGDVTAARLGPAAVGCVFHPEADASTVYEWFREPEVAKKLAERHAPETCAEMERRIDDLDASHRGLLLGFLECVS